MIKIQRGECPERVRHKVLVMPVRTGNAGGKATPEVGLEGKEVCQEGSGGKTPHVGERAQAGLGTDWSLQPKGVPYGRKSSSRLSK